MVILCPNKDTIGYTLYVLYIIYHLYEMEDPQGRKKIAQVLCLYVISVYRCDHVIEGVVFVSMSLISLLVLKL